MYGRHRFRFPLKLTNCMEIGRLFIARGADFEVSGELNTSSFRHYGEGNNTFTL